MKDERATLATGVGGLGLVNAETIGLLPAPPTLSLVPQKLSLFPILPTVKNKRREKIVKKYAPPAPQRIYFYYSLAPLKMNLVDLFDLAAAGYLKFSLPLLCLHLLPCGVDMSRSRRSPASNTTTSSSLLQAF